ncbi:MAG: hypothetical protein Q9197_001678 [Variospora fuerteventurae]
MLLEPWQNWVIVGLCAAGAYAYYSRTGNKRRGPARSLYVPGSGKRRTSPRRGSGADAGSSGSNIRRKNQAKKGEIPVEVPAAEASSNSVSVGGSGKVKKRKGGKQGTNQLAQSSAVDVAPMPTIAANDEEEAVDNREFAKQMSGLKTGSSLAKKDGPKSQTKKQAKQAELPLNSFNAPSPSVNGASTSKDLSNESSTTGADADDDLSPAASPSFGDVSDMLEAPGKGPSILRLTGVEEPKRHQRAQKVAQESETKKQRQNRRKNEEKKLAREQAEKDRRVLLEKQLRTAREAEGRSARNGLAAAPTSSAWNKQAAAHTTTSQQASPVVSNGSLLDTFDDSTTSVSNGHSHAPKNNSTANVKTLPEEVPSEGEQMRILSEMDGSGGWNTVSRGGKKKKSAVNGKENERKMSTTSVSVAETDDHSTSTSDDVVGKPTPSQSQTEDEIPKPIKTKKDSIDPKLWNRENIHLHPDYDPAYPYALTGHPEDSDWAVV